VNARGPGTKKETRKQKVLEMESACEVKPRGQVGGVKIPLVD
jgi:hypothetical protein